MSKFDKCSCGRPTTGTFWTAYHEFPERAIIAQPCCEDCGQDWILTWDEYGRRPRPKGYWPGLITDNTELVSQYLERIAEGLDVHIDGDAQAHA